MKKFRSDASRAPLLCAGRRQFKSTGQASIVSQRCQQTPTMCRCCGCWHLIGQRRG